MNWNYVSFESQRTGCLDMVWSTSNTSAALICSSCMRFLVVRVCMSRTHLLCKSRVSAKTEAEPWRWWVQNQGHKSVSDSPAESRSGSVIPISEWSGSAVTRRTEHAQRNVERRHQACLWQADNGPRASSTVGNDLVWTNQSESAWWFLFIW